MLIVNDDQLPPRRDREPGGAVYLLLEAARRVSAHYA